MLKQESIYYDHFCRFLRPLAHYIPFTKDLDELDSPLGWADSSETEVQTMIGTSRRLAKERLEKSECILKWNL